MASEPNLLPLKLLVISMGVMLIGAILFMLFVIAGKAHSEMHASDCPDATFHVNAGGNITTIMPQDRTVQVTLNAGQQDKVLTVDRCTGKLLQTLTIAP